MDNSEIRESAGLRLGALSVTVALREKVGKDIHNQEEEQT